MFPPRCLSARFRLTRPHAINRCRFFARKEAKRILEWSPRLTSDNENLEHLSRRFVSSRAAVTVQRPPPPPAAQVKSEGLFIATQLEMESSITSEVFQQYTRWSYNWGRDNKSCSACGNTCQSAFFLSWMFLFVYFASKECLPCSCYVEMEKHVSGSRFFWRCLPDLGKYTIVFQLFYCISLSGCWTHTHTHTHTHRLDQSVFLNLRAYATVKRLTGL
jgi:hypothetical protein